MLCFILHLRRKETYSIGLNLVISIKVDKLSWFIEKKRHLNIYSVCFNCQGLESLYINLIDIW